MNKGTLAAGGLLIVGVGAFGAAILGPGVFSSTPATQYLTSQATLTDVVDQVAATGTIGATTYSFAFGSAPTTSQVSSSSSSSSNSSLASSSSSSGNGSSG